MTGRTLERRLRAMEERMGGDDPLRALSDLDLLRVIEAVATHLAATGDAAAMATLADHDAQEAAWRAFQERPDIARSHVPMLEPDTRWPHLRARARWYERTYGRHEPASAPDAAALWARLGACLDPGHGTLATAR